MKNKTLLYNGTLVNENEQFEGYLILSGERIETVGRGPWRAAEGAPSLNDFVAVIDAEGGWILPGVIDDQVHFRDPGMSEKATIETEAQAAVAGGVTSFMDMPNTRPAAVTAALVEDKFRTAAEKSVANFSFYMGATNSNIDVIKQVDPKHICGVKVFMGSSTGNMLVDDTHALARIFAESPVLVATHCEEEAIVRQNLTLFQSRYGENITPEMHPQIRTEEACYTSAAKAVELATKYNTNLHLLHVSTAKEMTLFQEKPLAEKRITCEVCVHHLWFSDQDYAAKGNLIKWNPAIKTEADRAELRAGVNSGRVDVIATDHAPHTLAEKSTSYLTAPSGGPMVQHSLVTMLEMVRQGVFTVEKVVEKMSHALAVRYQIKERGFLREGYYADVVVVAPNAPWRVSKANILYKCGWSPLEGQPFNAQVTHTLVNGRVVYQDGKVDTTTKGKALEFSR